jgi:phosphoserine aminotransferase
MSRRPSRYTKLLSSRSTMARAFNFSAGPAILPEEVLLQAREELLDWDDSGMSPMEMSHRAEPFASIAREAEADLRELLWVPDNYRILFLQGGASAQFAWVPMNLLGAKLRADYIDTGYWSGKAIAEARRFCEVNVAASGAPSSFSKIPGIEHWRMNPDAAYVHFTPNETINGVEFHWTPRTFQVPLIADMSSTLLSRPIDVTQYGLIYAGAQKNIGPAGLTLVIIRDDLMGSPSPSTSPIFTYRAHAEQQSMFNTPPTFAWYMAGLVFKWLKAQGGLAAMGMRNRRKAEKLYAAIDDSDFYQNPIDMDCRSWMNIPFSLAQPERETEFLRGAEKAGLLNLQGHRSVGGARASLYNAMPEAGIDALIAYMREFERSSA